MIEVTMELNYGSPPNSRLGIKASLLSSLAPAILLSLTETRDDFWPELNLPWGLSGSVFFMVRKVVSRRRLALNGGGRRHDSARTVIRSDSFCYVMPMRPVGPVMVSLYLTMMMTRPPIPTLSGKSCQTWVCAYHQQARCTKDRTRLGPPLTQPCLVGLTMFAYHKRNLTVFFILLFWMILILPM